MAPAMLERCCLGQPSKKYTRTFFLTLLAMSALIAWSFLAQELQNGSRSAHYATQLVKRDFYAQDKEVSLLCRIAGFRIQHTLRNK